MSDHESDSEIEVAAEDPSKKRLAEAVIILRELGFPTAQQNERSAFTLLALLNLKPNDEWTTASDPLIGVTQMMKWFADVYDKHYQPNTRESVRRQTIHQFLDAGLIVINPDKPERPVNSGSTVYQIAPTALELLRSYGTDAWASNLTNYRAAVGTLSEKYAQARQMKRLPVILPDGQTITLSPGGQNVLILEIIENFCPYFTPGGRVLYVGDADEKWGGFRRGKIN